MRYSIWHVWLGCVFTWCLITFGCGDTFVDVGRLLVDQLTPEEMAAELSCEPVVEYMHMNGHTYHWCKEVLKDGCDE